MSSPQSLDFLAQLKLMIERKTGKIWIVRYIPEGKEYSEFYRMFIMFSELVQSLSLPEEQQHPAWKHPYEIWEVDFKEGQVQEITTEVRTAIQLGDDNGDKLTTADSGDRRTPDH